MKIETKFNINDGAYLFNINTMKLVSVSIIGIEYKIAEDNGPLLLYKLNLMKDFQENEGGQLLNEVEAFLAGAEKGEYIQVEERFLFRSPGEFFAQAKTDLPKIVEVEDGNT